MKCPICKVGETQPGRASATFERGGATIVFRDVPAHICANCGETYHDEAVAKALLEQAESAARAGIEIEVRHFARAA